MDQVHQVVMMKTIFNICIFLFTLTLTSQELFRSEFQIKNTGQNLGALKAQASAKSNRIIRDNAFLAFISLNQLNSELKSCWEKLLINKEIKIIAKSTSIKQLSADERAFTYQITFDPKKISISNFSLETFRKKCIPS